MQLKANEAKHVALEFIINEWTISDEYRDWVTHLDCRHDGLSWSII